MESSFISHSPKETKDLAQELARKVLSKGFPRKNALVVGLEGELGAGKTSFAQGFAKGLGVTEKILSPTFVILKKFEIRPFGFAQGESKKSEKNTKYNILNTKYFYHVDCYRLQNSKGLLALGWRKIIKSPQNIVLVEWADKIKKILPRDSLYIVFAQEDHTTRRLMVQ